MIQDIYPSKLDNSFRKIKPGRQDYLLHFDTNGKLLSKIENGCLRFTTADETSAAAFTGR